jgi:DNA-binding GntR family transcriptional regulator
MVEGSYGIRIVRARESFMAAAADAYNATLLGLRPGDPVLRTRRTSYDNSNLAVEYATSAMRTASLAGRTTPPRRGMHSG